MGGRDLIFDDSFEHEAWNESEADRVVLLIQFWHPDLTEAEIWALKELRRSWPGSLGFGPPPASFQTGLVPQNRGSGE